MVTLIPDDNGYSYHTKDTGYMYVIKYACIWFPYRKMKYLGRCYRKMAHLGSKNQIKRLNKTYACIWFPYRKMIHLGSKTQTKD